VWGALVALRHDLLGQLLAGLDKTEPCPSGAQDGCQHVIARLRLWGLAPHQDANLPAVDEEDRARREALGSAPGSDSEQGLPTIWHHGPGSYSDGKLAPVSVSPEEDFALRAFESAQASLTSPQLEGYKGVNNPSRVMKKLADRFPGRVRGPGSDRGTGWFVHVQPEPTK
jgi:hypothetical protein